MAASRSAVVKAKEKEGRQWALEEPGPSAWWHLAPSSYNFRADLEQLARVLPTPHPQYFQEMVRGSGDSPDRVLYLQKTTLPAHHTIPGSLQPDEAVSHQPKSFRPCSWPLDSWAALLGTGVSWAGGQSPRGGALDKSEECVGLWAVASEEVDIYPGLGARRNRAA